MSFVSRLVDPNPPSQVKRIQRGTISVPSGDANTGTVTILEVDLSKSTLTFLGAAGFSAVGTQVQGGGSQGWAYRYAYHSGAMIRLASATTIEWKKVVKSGGDISYEVIESV